MTTTESYDLDLLLFRRQFILGPRFAPQFPAWQQRHVSRRYCLTAHPDLSVTQVEDGGRSLTLVGYLLDPLQPEADDAALLRRLLDIYAEDGNVGALAEATSPLSGRWVIIAGDGDALSLLHDPVGLRQVCFTREAGETWCASQSGLLAEVLGLAPEPARLESLSASTRSDGQYWWPAQLTPFEAVHGLLPNHCLDLHTGVQRRYWPARPLGRLSLDDVVEASATILRGTISAAARRHRLAIALTAGLDSRTVLAACRDAKENAEFFTLLYWGATAQQPDARVAARMADGLGLTHRAIRCPDQPDGGFLELMGRNVIGARRVHGVINQTTLAAIPGDVMAVHANISEVARCYYHHTPVSEERVTAQFLAGLAQMRGDVAVEALEAWLAEALRSAHGLDLLDLFYWEQRMGGWLALCQAERDLAQEVLMPFNCRRLLEILLSAPEKYRRPPRYVLFRKLIASMWPEALDYPINPRGFRRTLGRVAAKANRRAARLLGLYPRSS